MKNKLKLIITIFIIGIIIGWCSVEAQEKSFVYSTDLETVLLQYTAEQLPEIEKDNSIVYVAIALVLLDVAINRYYYRNQYWNH